MSFASPLRRRRFMPTPRSSLSREYCAAGDAACAPATFTSSSRLDHEFATHARARDGSVANVASHRASAETLQIGELEIRLADGLVLAAGAPLTLSVREFELLVAMARRAGTIVARDELYGSVWGGELR